MILAILVFVMFVGGTTALAKKTGGLGRSGRGRLGGGSKSRGSGKSRTGGTSRSGGLGRGRSGSTSRTRTGGTGRAASGSRAARTPGRGSWFFKAWNASGAPKTSETTWHGASAVVTGKAAGAASRGGWWTVRKTGNAGRWFAGRALIPFDQWLERKRAGLETAAAFSAATPIAPENSKPQSATTPPPVHANPFRSNKGEPVALDAPSTFDRTAVPNTLAAHLNHIADLHPDNDAELLDFLKQEVTGMLAYAEAVGQMFDNCVTGHGLDPAAMQGVSDYAEAFAENANAAANGHKQFMAVYEAIIEAANNGTQMPYNGRFFSGEAAA